MKNHILFKFIAIALCALCLLGAVAGAAGIIGLSEMDLYNKTVEEYLAQELSMKTVSYANELALSYSSKILGGCPDDMIRYRIGDADWFIRQYPNHGYTITDADGKVLSSYNMEAALMNAWQTYSYPVTGKYMYLVPEQMAEAATVVELPRTVEPGTEYLYDAIQPMGSAVSVVTVGYPDGSSMSYGGENGAGFVFKDETGRVIFRGFEPDLHIIHAEPNYFRCLDSEDEVVFEISHPDTVGWLTTDENGFLVFRGNEPEVVVPETTEATVPETIPETTVVETVPVETDENGNPTTLPATETVYVEETVASNASAVPGEPEMVEETIVEITVAETVPPTTAPVETVPDIAVTEPVMIDEKPLSSYQINRTDYYDGMEQRMVTAKYVYVTMPDLTVTLYVDGSEVANDAVWNAVKVIRHFRQYLLPLVGLCLLGFAVLAVYLCGAAGRKPGVPEIRPGGLNRIPLDVYFLLGGAAVAGCVAAGLGAMQYLLPRDVITAFGVGMLLCYLGSLVFVGFCYALVAQFKAPDGYWWRNSLCGRSLRLCLRLAKRLKGFLAAKVLPWLLRAGKLLWQKVYGLLCRLETLVNRFLTYLPLMWQWLLCGGVCVLLVFASDGSIWSLILWFLVILYGAYCFGHLLDSTGRMSQGDLDTKVDEKHMVGAFQQFAQSLNRLAGVAEAAARKQLKSDRMKTELITNVSHDIKTPLTSIINYVDLLQKAQTEQERQEYLEVLDRQSQRLKKLIDDLMDMSKASTGNMTVDITRVDAVESVNQALGEFADKMDKAMLNPVFRHDAAVMPMLADGRLVWRVLSNLLTNAVKYALPGTRLYIDLSQLEGKVILSVKNISREPLNVDSEELLERFVRGDDSRNTEGSGLGLNIAKSLMELQKGELQLLVDGDLFKVTLIFPSA